MGIETATSCVADHEAQDGQFHCRLSLMAVVSLDLCDDKDKAQDCAVEVIWHTNIRMGCINAHGHETV